MQIKVIQINVYQGRYLENLLGFLSREYPDIIFMQEVTCGDLNLCDDKFNIFEQLKYRLNYQGVFFPTSTIEDKSNTFIGNAVLTRHLIKAGNYIPLKSHSSLTFSTFSDPAMFEILPKGIVEASIEISGRMVVALSCHGAWTAPPKDTRENLRQAKLVAKHLKSLDEPFVMGADMNMPPETRVVKTISKFAQNLMEGSGILQTTHPTVHKIAPRGFLVDYIFTSDVFERVSIEAPNVLVSDHLPLVATLELAD